ncbi:MAG: DUF86 domain-containing protein [Lachnospiraceae bacterium]|nr:DUF86 domain-containing protein [Lachnospiraceae bacterium]
MDNVKNDSYFASKIREDLVFIEKHTKGITQEELNANEILLDSMMFRLIQISENAKKLSEGYREQHSSIPWLAILGLRNRIVHDYGNVDLSIVFSTLKNDVPDLIRLINENDNP